MFSNLFGWKAASRRFHLLRKQIHRGKRPSFRFRPDVERIEDRFAPALSVSPNGNFAAQLYLDFLHRSADPAEASYWGTRCDQGTSRTDVAGIIAQTPEASQAIVSNAYQTLLNRAPDSGGLNYWTGYLAGGGSEIQMAIQFTASAEYFATRAAGDAARFVDAVYVDALGRATDDGSRQYWMSVLLGSNSGNVAKAIYQSTEHAQLTVNGIYNDLLRRDADSGGLAYFTSLIQSGTPLSKIRSTIAGSEEYFIAANSIDPNERFVSQAYQDVLARQPASDELSYWTTLLDQNRLTRNQVAQSFVTAPEFRAYVVNYLYTGLLWRAPTSTELSAGVTFLTAGNTFEQLAANIAGGGEYYTNRGGGTNDGFIAALYGDALRRAPDPGGAGYFTQLLYTGTSRTQVALMLFTSAEHYQVQLDDYYQLYLRRDPDAGGLNYFTNAMVGGMRDEQVIVTMVGSVEYFNWPTISISGLSSTAAATGQTVVVYGHGFDTLADAVSVVLTPSSGAPATYVTAYAITRNSIEFVAPPLADPTGRYSPQTVSVQVVEQNGSLIMATNAFDSLTVAPPLEVPAGVPAGAITRAFVTTGIDLMQTIKNASLSNPALVNLATETESLKAQEQASLLPALDTIIANPSATATLPTSNGQTFTLDAASLANLDRILFSFVDQFVSAIPAPHVSLTPPNTGNAAIDDLFGAYEGFHASLDSQTFQSVRTGANKDIEWAFAVIGTWGYGALEGYSSMTSLALGDELATSTMAPVLAAYATANAPPTLSATLGEVGFTQLGQSIDTMLTDGFPALTTLASSTSVYDETIHITGAADPLRMFISKAVPPSNGAAAVGSGGKVYEIETPASTITNPLGDLTTPPAVKQFRIVNNATSISLSAHEGTGEIVGGTLRVFNKGQHGSVMYPQASSDDPSLVVDDPLVPVVDGSWKEFPFSYNTAGMTPGTREGHILVRDVNGGPTISVPVTLTISANPVMQATVTPASPVYITKGDNSSDPQTITIANTGPDPSLLMFDYPTSSSNTLQVISPPWPGGLHLWYGLNSGESKTFQVVFTNTANLAPGNYNEKLSFPNNASGSAFEVPLTLIVAQPTIAVTPVSLSYTVFQGTSTTASQTLTVQNTGTQHSVLTYSMAADNGRVSIVGAHWSLEAGESDSYQIAYNTSGLAVGTYHSTITVSDPQSSNKTFYIPITVTVIQSDPHYPYDGTYVGTFTGTRHYFADPTLDVTVSGDISYVSYHNTITCTVPMNGYGSVGGGWVEIYTTITGGEPPGTPDYYFYGQTVLSGGTATITGDWEANPLYIGSLWTESGTWSAHRI